MAQLTYNPDVFRVGSEREAREIILTTEGGLKTDERWVRETPHLGDILFPRLGLNKDSIVVDYGCGIGRMAREAITRTGCQVLGVDISVDMRTYAPGYVQSESFSVVSVPMFQRMVHRGFRADAAISVWVLQHCLSPAEDIETIKTSLRPDGRFGVVNNNVRAVPTKEKPWASDGVSIRALLNDKMREVGHGLLSPEVVTDRVTRTTFWAIYTA